MDGLIDLGHRSITVKALRVMRLIVKEYGINLEDHDKVQVLSLVGCMCDVFATPEEKRGLAELESKGRLRRISPAQKTRPN